MSKKRKALTIFQSEKDVSVIPASRKKLWENIISHPCIQLLKLPIGMNAGAFARREMAHLGDAMVSIGGGEGIEHFARILLANGKIVFPIGLPIKARFGDGFWGSEGLARNMKADPAKYLGTDKISVTNKLHLASPTDTSFATAKVAAAINHILRLTIRPQAFLVRMLSSKHPDFKSVEDFFSNTIFPLLEANGYRSFQSSKSAPSNFFINVEIFDEIQFSQLVVADITGGRPNCLVELGYALGRNIPVLITAKEGTPPIFDVQAVETYFWSPNASNRRRIREAEGFLKRAMKRPSMVRSVPLTS